MIMNLKQKKNKIYTKDKIEPQNRKKRSVNFRNFAELYLRSLNTFRFQIWQIY